MRRLRSRVAGTDAGATLILVMVLIFMISIMSVAILKLGTTSIKSSMVTQEVAEEQYDEEAAMSTAIQGIQTQIYSTRFRDVGASSTKNVGGSTTARGLACDPVQSTGPNTVGQEYVTSCEADPAATTYTINTPLNSVMSLGTPAQDGGAGIQLSGTGALTVNGDVYSTSAIENPTNEFLANGFIEAVDGCTGTITSTRPDGATNCRTPSPTLTDPGYDMSGFGTTLTKADLPAISCAPAVVEFSPGYYGSAALLNAIFSNATCQSKVLWFPPGNYFFDFKDGQSPGATGNPVWNISNSSIRMVSGEQNPSHWPPSGANLHQSCNAPTTAGQTGANFIFGGRSQLNITAGRVALCGAYLNGGGQAQENQPATPVFGANASIGTVTPSGPIARYPAPPTAVSSGSSCTVGFSAPDRAQFWLTGANATANVTLNGTAGVSTSRRCMRVTDFSLPADIPAGSSLVNASIMARAGSTGTAANPRLIDFVVDGTGAAAAGSAALTQFTTGSQTLQTGLNATNTTSWAATAIESYDITANLYDQVYNEGLSDLSLLLRAWKTSSGTNYTVGVDTVQIVLQWIAPSVANQNKANYGTAGTNGYGIWSAATGSRNLSVAFHTTAGATGSGSQNVAANGNTFTTTANNCVAETDYPAGGTACAFLRTGNNSNVDLHVKGSLYAPNAAVQLRHTDISDAPVVSNGFIARKLYLQDAAMLVAYRTAGGSVFGVGWPGSVGTYNWTFGCSGACGSITRATSGYPNLAGITQTLVGTASADFSNGPHLYTGLTRDTTVNTWQFVSPYEDPRP